MPEAGSIKGEPGYPSAAMEPGQQQGNQSQLNTILTISKLKEDLQKAGFTDIKIISDSFVVQAKDKDGNPTVMTLSPNGVFAISEITGGQGKQAKAGSGSQTGMQHQ